MPLDEESQCELDLKRVAPHVEALAAKFDTVQVFVSRHDMTTGDTFSFHCGYGNWHARRGQIREWMIREDEMARASAHDEEDDE